MKRKLTERQRLIKEVAQQIYDSEYRLDYSDIRRLLSGGLNHWWIDASYDQRKRAECQVRTELDMAYFVKERSGKALVEIHANKEQESATVEGKNKNIGKRVFVEATYNPAQNDYYDETYGTIETVDETGCLFQIRRDCDDDLGWYDSRTLQVLTEEQVKYSLMTNPNPRQWARANVLDTAGAARYCNKSADHVRGAINRGELPAWKWDGSKVWLMFRDDVIAWRKSRRKYERKNK